MTQARNRIFISYRRDDARGASGRLYDWLRIAFGREQVFRDVASIGPGKWRQKIEEALATSAVCLPVIGLRWCDESNGPRLNDECDMVRYELLTALGSIRPGADHRPDIGRRGQGAEEGRLPRGTAWLTRMQTWHTYRHSAYSATQLSAAWIANSAGVES